MRYKTLFGNKKPVIAMLHLKGENREDMLCRATNEILIYTQMGVDALLVENYFGSVDDCETVLAYLQEHCPNTVYGVNILGDYRRAFALSARYGAKFIQIDSVCGHLPFWKERKFASELAQLRAQSDAVVLGGVRFKYQPVRSGRSLERDLLLGMERCDAVVVTGDATGQETPQDKVRAFRAVLGDFPLVVGAGATLDTVGETFSLADGAIVGSYFKKEHRDVGDVDAKTVRIFMEKKIWGDRVSFLAGGERDRLYKAACSDRSEDWTEFLSYYKNAPGRLQNDLRYALGALWSIQKPAGHFGSADIPLPFEFVSWTEVEMKEGSQFLNPAYLFRLRPECFRESDPLLVLSNEYSLCYGQELSWIERLSSGIADVQEAEIPTAPYRHTITFRLRRDAVKKTCEFNRKTVPLRPEDAFLLCVPCCGEFDCALGEMRDGQFIPLAADSFFYK